MDARATNRFRGEAPEPRPGLESGHIPGSANLPFPAVLEEGPGGAAGGLQLKSPERRREAFAAAGVDVERAGLLGLTCGSGVTSCVLYAALCALGRPAGGMAVYDGSFSEWGLPGQNRVAKGAPFS